MNPEDRETLFTIAEVAVAFVGFASIVSVLAGHAGRDNPHIDAARLRGMLFSSLSAIALCFIPVLAFRLGLSPSSVWRLSGVALFVGASLPFLRSLIDSRGIRKAGVSPGVGIAVMVVALFVLPAIMGVCLAIGLAEAPTYIAGVLVLLASSAIAFARLVLSYSTPVV